MQTLDAFGTDITIGQPDTINIWNAAMRDYLRFQGAPIGDLKVADDPDFLLGPVYCGVMKLLSGFDPRSSTVQRDLTNARHAAEGVSTDERLHLDAMEAMAAGNFSTAGHIWDKCLTKRPNDVMALKGSHESFFMVGALDDMLRSAKSALDAANPEGEAYHVAVGQYAFALEENGHYAEAEAYGRLGLSLEPEDCWSMHCLAHVFESQNRHQDGMGLLKANQPIWKEQNLLNAHIWWHMALRLVEAQEFDAALELFDEELAHIPANNQFRLTDSTSLLWRLQLCGVDVGNRWSAEAEKWEAYAETHSNPFLDMHAALAFASTPDTEASSRFFDTLKSAHQDSDHEVGDIFRTVVRPLVDAIRLYPQDKQKAQAAFEPLLPTFQRLGGSIVQRQIVERSYSSALIATSNHAKAGAFLDEKLRTAPNVSWLLRDRAKAAELAGNTQAATLYDRRADLMLSAW